MSISDLRRKDTAASRLSKKSFATSSLAVGRFAAKKGSLRSARGRLVRGGSRIFFTTGCTRLLLYFNTNKPYIYIYIYIYIYFFFFGRIPVVLENRRSSQGGGGGGGAHHLHPPPRSAPACSKSMLLLNFPTFSFFLSLNTWFLFCLYFFLLLFFNEQILRKNNGNVQVLPKLCNTTL